MAKGKVPTRDELLAFIKESATPVGKREIARAFGLKGDQRIELKELLRDLRDSGDIAADRAKTFKDPKALTDITVLEIVRVDDDGHLLAVPRRHDEEQDGPPPRIEIVPQASRGGVAPAVGDRVLASLKRRGKTAYEARIIRLLGSAPRKVLGLYEEPDGRNGIGLVTPTDRKLKLSFDIRPADKNGAEPGDIVWVEPAGGALARRASVIERVGPMSDPRTVSLISIAANDIPVEFPPAALEEAERARAAPLGPAPRPARHAAGHDRRRGRPRLRRRGVRRARPGPSRRLAHPGRHRRRRLVRAARQAARPRRLPPRHLGLFPRPGRAHAARGALQPLVLAGPAAGPAGVGGRNVDRCRRASQAPPLPPRHDPLGRAAHLHPRPARPGRHARRRDRAADGQRRPAALRRLQGSAGGAREARRARPRPARAPGHPGRRRPHRRDRRARAARQPQADRGVHGAGQRRGRPGAGAAPHPLPLPRP